MEIQRKYSYEKMLKVNDDWYPCFPKHEVYLHCNICLHHGNTQGLCIICIAGKDDYALEKRYYSNNIDELIEKYEEYVNFAEKIPEVTNKKWFLDRGFELG